MKTKETITQLLESTKRAGIKALIHWLEMEGFFIAPASTRFHGTYEGGLAEHSLRVYQLLLHIGDLNVLKLDAETSPGQKPYELGPENLVIAGLLHDVCKIGAYIPTPDGKNPYKWNRSQPKDHALLSIARLLERIKLAPVEELMIKYHMGPYGLNEFYGEDDYQTGEYPLRGDHSNDDGMTKDESKAARYGMSMANAWFHNPICKVMYFVDEIATFEEKEKEI